MPACARLSIALTTIQSLFQFPMLIYALVLLVIIIFRPRGILGTYEFSLDRLLFGKDRPGRKARKGGAGK